MFHFGTLYFGGGVTADPVAYVLEGDSRANVFISEKGGREGRGLMLSGLAMACTLPGSSFSL